MKYLKYLSYVLRHKWYVFIAACKLGIPLRGFLHDISKFRPSEFFPYMDYFYGQDKTEIEGGYYKPDKTGDDAFDRAWLLHQHRNEHHWQYWALLGDDGGFFALEMPENVRKELLADWIGAGKAQGNNDSYGWYKRNKHKMVFGPETQKWIESYLRELD